MDPRDAIFEACRLRFRPIMMTTMAAMLGALPLALSFGTGGELRRPLGISIVGGLMLSQVLTLYTRRWCICISTVPPGGGARWRDVPSIGTGAGGGGMSVTQFAPRLRCGVGLHLWCGSGCACGAGRGGHIWSRCCLSSSYPLAWSGRTIIVRRRRCRLPIRR